MKPQSLEATGLEKYRKKTRKEIFLEKMSEIFPRVEGRKATEPLYLKASKLDGRSAEEIEHMLRIHFLQLKAL